MDTASGDSLPGRARPWSAAPLRPSSSATLSTRLQQQRPWSAVCIRAEHLSGKGGRAALPSTHGTILDDTLDFPWPTGKSSRPSVHEFPDVEPRTKSYSSAHPPVAPSLGRWADYFNIGKDRLVDNLEPLNHLADSCISPYKGYILNARHWLHNSSIAVALLRTLLQEQCFLGGADFVREKKQPSLQHLAGNEAIDLLLRAVAELCDQVALYHEGLHRANSFKAEQEAEALRKQVAELTAEYNAEKLRRLDTHDRLRKAQQSTRWGQRMTEIPMSQWVDKIVDGGSELLKEVMETTMPSSEDEEAPVIDWPHALEVLDKAWAVRYHEAKQKAEADMTELREEHSRLVQHSVLMREKVKEAEEEAHNAKMHAKVKHAQPQVRSSSSSTRSPSKPRQSVVRSVTRQSVARQSILPARGEKQSRAAGSAYVFAFGTKVYAGKNRSASLTAPAALPSELHDQGAAASSVKTSMRRSTATALGLSHAQPAERVEESWAKMRDEAHRAAETQATSDLENASLLLNPHLETSALESDVHAEGADNDANVTAAVTAPAALEPVLDHDVTLMPP